MTTITTVVFDFGNVLIGWDPRRALAATHDDAEIDVFLAEAAFAELNAQLDRGRPYDDVRAMLAERAPRHVSTLDAYWNNFEASLTGPVPRTVELVSELAETGIRLLGLTNWSAETFHHSDGASPAVALLEGVVVSGREGLTKPDPAIFRLLVERYGLVPTETLFVDDSAANVDGARSVGLLAHRFTDAASLRTELRTRGVDLRQDSE